MIIFDSNMYFSLGYSYIRKQTYQQCSHINEYDWKLIIVLSIENYILKKMNIEMIIFTSNICHVYVCTVCKVVYILANVYQLL